MQMQDTNVGANTKTLTDYMNLNSKLEQEKSLNDEKVKAAKMERAGQLLGMATPENYGSIRRQAIQEGMGTEETLPMEYSEEWINQSVAAIGAHKSNVPSDIQGFNLYNAMSPQDKTEYREYRTTWKPTTLSERISPAPKDSREQPSKQAKPLSVKALKMQQESLDSIGTANSIDADLGQAIKLIDDGKLNFGLISNALNIGKNYIGSSDEESRNYQTFKSTLEKLRNDSLRLNKGVQTEGDSQRAWNELLTSMNDSALVKQRLQEIQQINRRAAELQENNIEQLRSNFGLEPLDTSAYKTKPAIFNSQANQQPQSNQTAPAGAKLIGSSGGKAVYQMPDGTHVMEQ